MEPMAVATTTTTATATVTTIKPKQKKKIKLKSIRINHLKNVWTDLNRRLNFYGTMPHEAELISTLKKLNITEKVIIIFKMHFYSLSYENLIYYTVFC
jgi:restriction endonuclease